MGPSEYFHIIPSTWDRINQVAINKLNTKMCTYKNNHIWELICSTYSIRVSILIFSIICSHKANLKCITVIIILQSEVLQLTVIKIYFECRKADITMQQNQSPASKNRRLPVNMLYKSQLCISVNGITFRHVCRIAKSNF